MATHRLFERSNLVLNMVAIALILALPVLVLLAAAGHGLYLYRLRAAANRAGCPACGHRLGTEALRQADQYWQGHLDELRRTYPGIRFRVVRLIHAICTECRSNLFFDEKAGTFTKTQA